jgi:hypothetical protein
MDVGVDGRLAVVAGCFNGLGVWRAESGDCVQRLDERKLQGNEEPAVEEEVVA